MDAVNAQLLSSLVASLLDRHSSYSLGSLRLVPELNDPPLNDTSLHRQHCLVVSDW
jgi:hypothetical protein